MNRVLRTDATTETKKTTNGPAPADILRFASIVVSSLNLNQIMGAACKTVVEMLHVDHSGLALFSPDRVFGSVEAEYPDGVGARGTRIPLTGIPAEERLIANCVPIIANDIASSTDLGSVKNILLALGIRSMLVVPIVVDGQAVGSFSVDVMGRSHSFSEDEIETCEALATLLAHAIDHSRRHSDSQSRASRLEALRTASNSLSPHRGLPELYEAVVDTAAKLVNATGGGLYIYDHNRERLRCVFATAPNELRAKTLNLGEGMAGKLLTSGARFSRTDCYDQSPERSLQFGSTPPFGSVLEVPVGCGGDVFGVLFVDDQGGRNFTDAEAELLAWFAEYAAINLRDAQTMTAEKNSLQLLINASRVLAGIDDLRDALQRLTEMTVTFMETSFCRILLLDHTLSSLTPVAAATIKRVQPLSWDPHLETVQHLLRAPDAALDGIAILDSRTSPEYLAQLSIELALSRLIQSMMVVPLKAHDHQIGVMQVWTGPHF